MGERSAGIEISIFPVGATSGSRIRPKAEASSDVSREQVSRRKTLLPPQTLPFKNALGEVAHRRERFCLVVSRPGGLLESVPFSSKPKGPPKNN